MNTAGDDPRAKIDPAVWQEPDMRAALRVRDVGGVYRLLKRHGVSQRRIAGLTGQTQPEVSDIMKGRQVMAYDVLSRIADGLGIPRGFMGLAYDGDTASLIVSHGRSLEVAEMPDRREFISIVSKLAMGVSLTAAERVLLATPATATPAPSRVGTAEIRQLAETTEFFWGQEKRFGGGTVRDAVLAQLQWVRGLLPNASTSRAGVELLGVLSDLARLAGQVTRDVGQPGPALRLLGQSLDAAQEASDSFRAVMTLELTGGVYLREGNYGDALSIFQLAQVPARKSGQSHAVALLLADEARAHAEMGSKADALAAMGHAWDALDGPVSSGREAPAYIFDEHVLTNIEGNVQTVLSAYDSKHCDRAVELLTTTTADLANPRVKRRAFGLVELATCHFRQGDIDHASRIGHQALDLVATLRSTRAVQHLDILQAAAAKHVKKSDASDLIERITQTRSA